MKYSIDDKNTTAILLKSLRLEEGITQQELAERAGVSFSFVNQVERGKPTLRLDALNKLLEVFGYGMAPHLLSGANAPRFLTKSKASVKEEKTVVAEKPAPRQEKDWSFF
jgi:y4mF family transcriptional regulator